MIKIGVIGVGAMGKNHARIYNEIEDVELVGVSDVNEKVAKEVALKYNTNYFVDHVELLEKIDAVSIATPTTMHADIAITAAEHGVHMLVEKPISDSLSSADRMIKAARKSGVKLMVGHIERFNPAVLKLKKLIKNGELGEIITISAKRVGPYHPRIRDVGIIIDLAVHDIDVMSYIYGNKIEEVYAIAGNRFHTKEDYASILLRFEGNKSGMIETNWLTPKKIRTLTAVGSGGVAKVNYIDQSLEVMKSDNVELIDIKKKEPLRIEIEKFVSCVIENKKPSPSGEDGKLILGVAIAAINSYMMGKPFKLKDVLAF
ncbi:gfo/Idh/MocA family oxidoreductase [Archaeoglobales archaeon]|nr:MAG: gfo/Idh/MocA family oxidoreductase [Archaeoglobales archaeon]